MDRMLLCSLLLMAALTGQAQTKPDRQAMSQLLLTSLYDSLTHPILLDDQFLARPDLFLSSTGRIQGPYGI